MIKSNFQKDWSGPKSIEILPNKKPTAPIISCEFTFNSKFISSGGSIEATYRFKDVGAYHIKMIAKDKKGGIADTSSPFTLTVFYEDYVIRKYGTEERYGFLSSAEIDVETDKCIGIDYSGYGYLYLYFLKIPRVEVKARKKNLVSPEEDTYWQWTVSCDNTFVYAVENNEIGNHLSIFNKSNLSLG